MHELSKLAVAAAVFCGVSGPVSAAVADTTITFIDITTELQDYWKALIERFEAANPGIDVEYRWLANEPYKTGIKVMTESNSPPDVFYIWAGSWAKDMVDQGAVLDLSDSLADGDAWAREMPEGLVRQFSYLDSVWGAAVHMYAKFMWKNDAFFAEHGLTIPATIDELKSFCGAVREIDERMIPISFGASESWTINHYLTILFQRHVPIEIRERDFAMRGAPEELFIHPGYQNALQDLMDLKAADCFNDGVISVTPETSRIMFSAGLAATTFCGTWCIAQFDDQGFEGRYSPFPFPVAEGGEGAQDGVMVGASGYQISSKTQHPEAAIAFLGYMLSPENQALMTRETGFIPAKSSALQEGDLPPPTIAVLELVDVASVADPALNTVLETSVSDVVLKSGQDLFAETITPAEFMQRVRDQAMRAVNAG